MSRLMARGLVLSVLILFCQCVFAQTLRIEYYKWTKTFHKSGKVETKDGKSGQFITRTRKVCYDSDREGCTVNNGSLTLVNQQGNTSKYTGPSYYGAPTSYTFYDDKGILNIQDRDGNVYVYKKVTAPSGRKTSSLIASKRNSGSEGSSGGVYVSPVNTGSNTGSSVSEGQHTKTKHARSCRNCNGGVCRTCGGRGTYLPYVGAKNYTRCAGCDGTGKCRVCNGTGISGYY